MLVQEGVLGKTEEPCLALMCHSVSSLGVGPAATLCWQLSASVVQDQGSLAREEIPE